VLPALATLSALASGGCQPAPKLVRGCYYLGGQPVLRIAGDRGNLLVPGPVRDFRVARKGAEVQVRPGFLFDSAGQGLRSVAWSAPQSIGIKRGAAVPTLIAHHVGYGDSELVLGKSCPLAM